MKIGGFLESSLIDYPGKVAAVIFTVGCTFRCRYCHNPRLVYPELYGETVPLEKIMSLLERRRGLLDGVVFCGGEPTMQEDLPEVMRRVRSLGYLVKLDTNGAFPEKLAEALPYADYVAMDIKAPFGPDYARVCGGQSDDFEVRRSMLLLRSSGVEYHFRTTFHPDHLPVERSGEIERFLGAEERYVIQHASVVKK
jgi:pyruvate formate lyase activating enzyme